MNLIDRYLAAAAVTRKNLQLVGVTAMLLASKRVTSRGARERSLSLVSSLPFRSPSLFGCRYEEIWAPEVRDFVYISDKAYTREQILACEKGMLNTLGFHLTVPTPFQFLTRLLKAGELGKEATQLATYLLELALPDYGCLRFKASLLAAAAVYTAQRGTRGAGPPGWCHVLARHSRYSEAELLPCAHALARLQRKAGAAQLTAVHKKYTAPKFGEVAKLATVDGLGEDV